MQLTEPTEPIMLRARLTESEWARIRKEAIDRRLNTSEFVGRLIRAGLECLPAEEVQDGNDGD